MDITIINGKFYGAKKIKEATKADRETYLGNLVFKITFEDGTMEEVTAKNLELGMTDEASDATTLRDKLVNDMVEKIMAVMLEGEIKIGDIEYLKARITGNVNFHQEQAEDILWGKSVVYDVTLADVNLVETKQKK